ncbi:MAG: metallophosphoesterase [Oscillospiraceae bacterium]|nr:metallophosphoesterase [Oscillospiraceae bacterium]
MVYITGDMHGEIARFEDKALARLKRNDFLIVCGDFGFIWEGGKNEEKTLKFLGKQRYTILFVDGTHENFDLLYRYPVGSWNGGKVHRIDKNLYHLCRGQVFEIDGKSFFTMGGGESADTDLRQKRGSKWWEQELPTIDEMQEGVDNLYKRNLTVDYLITHEPPSKVKTFLTPGAGFNPVNAFLDELAQEVTYKHWFFGSLHIDKGLSSAHTSVFNRIVNVDSCLSRNPRTEKMHSAGNI